jgi:glycosyltransferase involved in cell wall biosynthesis
MRVSVVIPTFNSAATIQATLDSVLGQTMPPDEILVLDDGSTDSTCSLLKSYGSRVTLSQQQNRGVANARNTLCSLAKGSLVAFLDHDDLWHPRYLEAQWKRFGDYPHAVGFFAGHVNFSGYEKYEWDASGLDAASDTEVIDPLDFFKRLHLISGFFGSASFLCVPKRVLAKLGDRPFHERLSGVDDCYLCSNLALLGPVVYAPDPLVAYRIIKDAQSVNKVKACRLLVEMFHILEDEGYEGAADATLSREFRKSFAAGRRSYAKILMGVGNTSEARAQLTCSLGTSLNVVSIAKSLALLLLTCMPTALQPKWPASQRQWTDPVPQ